LKCHVKKGEILCYAMVAIESVFKKSTEMRNLELEGFGLVEMKNAEMFMLDGGGWVGDAIRWIWCHKDEICTAICCIAGAFGSLKQNLN